MPKSNIAMEIASDSNADTSAKALHHEIYKVNKIFRAFCNEQNCLGFKEFKDLDGATEEGESQLTEESFGQLCHFLMVQNPSKGLDINEFSLIYLNRSACEALGSDLNSDFGTLFPAEAKVALIFDAFDSDQDGYLNETEFDHFLKAIENSNMAEKANAQVARQNLYSSLGTLLQYDCGVGVDLSLLIELYFSDDEQIISLCSEVLNLTELDIHAEVAAKSMGL